MSKPMKARFYTTIQIYNEEIYVSLDTFFNWFFFWPKLVVRVNRFVYNLIKGMDIIKQAEGMPAL